jgi:hypothetical protein
MIRCFRPEIFSADGLPLSARPPIGGCSDTSNEAGFAYPPESLAPRAPPAPITTADPVLPALYAPRLIDEFPCPLTVRSLSFPRPSRYRVVLDRPVALATMLYPPYPSASASTAAHTRRLRSSSTSDRRSNLVHYISLCSLFVDGS